VLARQVPATWEEIDFVLRLQELPVAGNSRSFQALLARHKSSSSLGVRVWAALKDLREMRELDRVLFQPGSLEAEWRAAREAVGLPTHVRVLADRGQLLCGDVLPTRGWRITDDKPVRLLSLLFASSTFVLSFCFRVVKTNT
jgi:hypothetical protein